MKGVISIGANIGQEYEQWVSEGAKNFIFIEPIRATYERLEQILGDKKGVLCFNMAIGNMNGEVEMFVETVHQGKSCSILQPKKHLEQYPDIVFPSKEMVTIRELDNLIYNRDLYEHMQIDAQGYELEVLKGAENSLKYIDTIKTEVYRDELYEGCPMIDEVTKFLSKKGFVMDSVKWMGISWGDAWYSKLKKS